MADDHLKQVVKHLENGIKFSKCWKCGCQQGAVKVIESQLLNLKQEDQNLLKPLLEKSKATFQPVEYDCLGCKVCFPSVATNALMTAYPTVTLESDGCATDAGDGKERSGWPPFPGNYELLRYQAPVAVCTLNTKEMIKELSSGTPDHVGIVGSLNTENLGIERLIKNIVTNPHIRFLVLCGKDSEQMIGHLPGQSLISLFQNGIDTDRRIIGAKGKRPVLKNIEPAYVDRFRKQVELVNMVGCIITSNVIKMADYCGKKERGVFDGGDGVAVNIERIEARPPKRLALDPKGYFVIFPNAASKSIIVEHYHMNGILNKTVEGRDIGSIYMTIIELDLVSKLDHACYLGKELARAEESLRTGKPYVQDRAQDQPEEPSQKTAVCKPGCC